MSTATAIPTATATADPFDFLDSVVDSPIEADPEPVAKPAPAAPSKTRATSRARTPLYIDIETVPDESRMELFGLDPLPVPAVYQAENDCMAPSEMLRGTIPEVEANIAKATAKGKLPRVVCEAAIKMEKASPKPRSGVYKLFEKMIDEMDGEGAAIAAATEAQRKLMSVTPEFCRIVSLAWAVGNDPTESMVVGMKSADGTRVLSEVDLLNKFWSLTKAAGVGVIVTKNGLHFDIPAIFVRSILLDIANTHRIDLSPYGGDVLDLQVVRFGKGFGSGDTRKAGICELKRWAKVMGVPVPEEGCDGSQVYQLFVSGELEKLGRYNRSDVEITRAIHKRYRGTFC